MQTLLLCLIGGLVGGSLFLQLFVLSPALYNSHRQDDGASKVPPSLKSHNSPIPPSRQSLEFNDTGTSSCILVMDDNHLLVEWLAYHYHVIKLRHLIVAVDPRSLTSPEHILERWKGLMDIELWDKEDIYINRTKFDAQVAERLEGYHGKRESSVLSMHRVRQLTFNMECMKAHKKKGLGWTFITDTDEYTYINPRLWKEGQKLYVPDFEDLPSIREADSVYKMLQQLRFLNPNTVHAAEQYPCIRIKRRQFSSIDGDKNKKGSSISYPNSALPIPLDKFQTLRWRKWEFLDDHHPDLAGKTIVDLAALSLEDLEAEANEGGGDPHLPLPNICAEGGMFLGERRAPLLANHYMGTREQWNYRSNDSRGAECIRDLFDHQNNIVGKYHSNDVVPWLEGFVSSTGLEKASRLLEGAGELEPKADGGNNSASALSKDNDSPIRVGDRVQYFYEDDWHTCTVMASNCRGGYDIKCDENDFWGYALRFDDLFLLLTK
jgi:hypothetical protein